MTVRVGTAAWAVPRGVADAFPATGSALERYAARFDAAEIDSTFRRSHRALTYTRWAASTPEGFRFAVKTPRAITHDARLQDCATHVDAFVAEIAPLGARLGPILVQLPPSLAYDAPSAARVLDRLGGDGARRVVCEPRHASWFTAEVDHWLAARRVSRVAADPALHAGAAEPGGWTALEYHRLHGSPRVYRSAYGAEAVTRLAQRLSASVAECVWCVFDNTASGAATADALALRAALAPVATSRSPP